MSGRPEDFPQLLDMSGVIFCFRRKLNAEMEGCMIARMPEIHFGEGHKHRARFGVMRGEAKVERNE
jgi:hypothetical protein